MASASRQRRRRRRSRQRAQSRLPTKFSQTICLEIIGVAEIITGFFSIIIEAVSLRFPTPFQRYATGVFSGVVSVACGVITVSFALRTGTRWFITTCLLHLMALIVVVTGISCVMQENNLLITLERSNSTLSEAQRNFMEWKNRMVLTMNEAQFAVSILLTMFLLISSLRRRFAERPPRHRRHRESVLLDFPTGTMHHNSIDLFAFSPPTYSSLFLHDLFLEPPPPYEDPEAPPLPPPFYVTERRSSREVIRFRSGLTVLGTVQTVLGILTPAVDVGGLFVGDHMTQMYGSGIYTGLLFTLAGILSLIGSCGSDAHCLNAALVVNTIGTCACIPGLHFASLEAAKFSEKWQQSPSGDLYYHKVKNYFVIIVIVSQLALAVIRTALTCSSQWHLCRPQEVSAQISTVTEQYAHCSPPPTYVVHYITEDTTGQEVNFASSRYAPRYVHSALTSHVTSPTSPPPPARDLPPTYEAAIAGMF